MTPNVLHIIDSFEQGGTERQAVQLARLLHESGRYRVHMASLHAGGPLRAEAERVSAGEVPEFRLNSFYDLNFTRQLRRLRRLIREREIQIVHTHDFYTNIFGMAGAYLARAPVRIASKRETEGFRSAEQKRLERAAYRFAQVVVANAAAVGQQLVREGVPKRKIITLYNGLDLSRVEPPADFTRASALRLFNLPAEPPRRFVTIVANVQHPVKDHPMFLRAARRVKEAVPEAAFVIAGEGRLLEELRTYASELGLERDVFFIGRCTRLAELLALSEICVLSSQAEGFSNSILEYMAAARPVVATNVGGASEAIIEGETGYLVAAGDDASLAARIISLFADPERAREMGALGRRVVSDRFSCAAQLERTQELYDRLLTKGRLSQPTTCQVNLSL